MTKHYQMFHRFNFQVKLRLEERVCVWFEWDGEINDDNVDQFEKVMYDALSKQQPPSWKLPFDNSQRKNIALGNKHHPELSWSTVMICEGSGNFETPVFVKSKKKEG